MVFKLICGELMFVKNSENIFSHNLVNVVAWLKLFKLISFNRRGKQFPETVLEIFQTVSSRKKKDRKNWKTTTHKTGRNKQIC